jgi:hypothetical protein
MLPIVPQWINIFQVLPSTEYSHLKGEKLWRYALTWKLVRSGPNFEILWERSRTHRFGKAGMISDCQPLLQDPTREQYCWYGDSDGALRRLTWTLLHLGATDDWWLVVGDISGEWMTQTFPVSTNMTHTWRTFFIDWATQSVSDAIQLSFRGGDGMMNGNITSRLDHGIMTGNIKWCLIMILFILFFYALRECCRQHTGLTSGACWQNTSVCLNQHNTRLPILSTKNGHTQ